MKIRKEVVDYFREGAEELKSDLTEEELAYVSEDLIKLIGGAGVGLCTRIIK